MRHDAKKNLVVPVFIPHKGCPHQCVFCNQNKITGSNSAPTVEEVREYLACHLSPETSHAVIAFYGGSFTGLPAMEQDGYLSVAGEFVARGFAKGLRLSTRPDRMDEGIAGRLKAKGVITVELGVQSLDDGVLKASGRGHTAQDAVNAAECVKSAGLELGIQIMCGLPGDTPDSFKATVGRVIELNPHLIRIYPLLVVINSPLEGVLRRNEYVPLGIDEAVSLCADAVRRFREAGIKVIRVGLQPSKELEESLLAGPYHPAFGHLVESELAFQRMKAALSAFVGRDAHGAPEVLPATPYEFLVHPADLSVYKGIRCGNVRKLALLNEGSEISIRADAGVEKGGLRLDKS